MDHILSGFDHLTYILALLLIVSGALSDFALPEQSVLMAVVFINVGVELGPLLFVAMILLFGWILHQLRKPQLLKHAETVAIYSIGGISSFWIIQRISLF